jgi:hypothetical protein
MAYDGHWARRAHPSCFPSAKMRSLKITERLASWGDDSAQMPASNREIWRHATEVMDMNDVG